jgi:glutamine---fructose-6-phosphate transaminase (isomerizing)
MPPHRTLALMKSLGNFPDPFIAEISGQPAAVRRAAEGLAEQGGALDVIGASARKRSIVFTGMGSSYDACYPAVAELARSGIAAVMLDASELLHFRTGMLGPSTLLVAVSQSGESAEVVRVTRLVLEGDEPPTVIAVTNGVDNELATLADVALDTRAGKETGPSTMTFAGSLVVVAAVARVITGRASDEVCDELRTGAAAAAVEMERILANTGLPDELVAWLGARETVVILGRGPARAAAEMGSLTIKEAVGMPVESLQTAQFRHGPLELVGPGLAAIVIATEPETRGLDVGLAAEMRAAGAGVVLVTEEAEDAEGLEGALKVTTGSLDRALAPAVSLLPSQLLAWRLASLRGRQPGSYYRATKVTTRE